jgi:hypothetical protein
VLQQPTRPTIRRVDGAQKAPGLGEQLAHLIGLIGLDWIELGDSVIQCTMRVERERERGGGYLAKGQGQAHLWQPHQCCKLKHTHTRTTCSITVTLSTTLLFHRGSFHGGEELPSVHRPEVGHVAQLIQALRHHRETRHLGRLDWVGLD